MKIKPRTKKILVLSVMVALLVATGVLNWALNNRLTTSDPIDAGVVTETFFAAYRSDREAARESEFLYLDAIITSETSSAEAKSAAEEQKLGLSGSSSAWSRSSSWRLSSRRRASMTPSSP